MYKVILAFCISFLIIKIANAQDSDFAQLFNKYNIEGSIVVVALNDSAKYIHNKQRAEQRLLPASTFKIPNTLIALEEKIIADENSMIKWDGKDKGMKIWNKDQTLTSAFSLSCVWCYQEFAKQINNEKYLSHLQKMEYGNQKTGTDITTFWLAGDLKISAMEQISFLRKLYRNELPYKKEYIETLKQIMLVEQTPEYTIRAKTGWAVRIKPQHGWYVGYVETKNNVWFFATNITIEKKSDLKYRQAITMEAFKLKGIISGVL